jgi:hypothetical protein
MNPKKPPHQPDRPAPTGFPEPPASYEPGNRSNDPEPHHALNNPVGEPDPTEWPDPYEIRDDPAAPPAQEDGLAIGEHHAPTGRTSTSEPHHDQDIESTSGNAPDRDRLDE